MLVMKMDTLLVRMSGSRIDDENATEEILNESNGCSAVELIHGAGEQFNQASDIPVVFETGRRVADQDQLKKFYLGPQQEIRDKLYSIFRPVLGDRLNIISPITEENGKYENINGDDRFIKRYKELNEQGCFGKGIIYPRKGSNKSRLLFPNVRISEDRR
jgi:hypothetical protein